VPRFSIDYEGNFARAQGNFEEQNKLDSSIIIINYCITIINACNNYTINAEYNYYFSNKVPQEYDKEANVSVIGDVTASCVK